MIYLCFPNNPTGAVVTKPQLETWVDWARRTGAVLLFDAAYEAYIRDPESRTRSTRSRARARSPSSSAASPRPPASPAPAAPSRSCPRSHGAHGRRRARAAQRASGAAGSRPSSTACPTSSRARPPPCTPTRARSEVSDLSTSTWRTPHHPRRPGERRPHRLRRRERPLHLGQDPAGPDLLGVLRQAPERGPRRRHARLRLRPQRRGLLPPDRLRLARPDRGGDLPHQDPPHARVASCAAQRASAVCSPQTSRARSIRAGARPSCATSKSRIACYRHDGREEVVSG